MITHDGMSELLNYKKIRELGISQETFFSLPYEYQRAIIMAGFDSLDKEKKKDNLRKRRALKQYELEEKVKKKVLTLFNKNR